MEIDSLTKFWPLIYSVIRTFWNITEPHIEEAAIRNDIPIELYYYSELGLDIFSIESFQNRDPFTNPEQFERLFARLNIRSWIEPLPDQSYQVTERAREAVRRMIQAGDMQLLGFELVTDIPLAQLVTLLKRVVAANRAAPEPPEKWAVLKRFRVADEFSSRIVQVRESLMDLFAYRDDSHLSASRPYFHRAGIVWSVLGSLWKGEAVTPKQMAERMAFLRYEENDFEAALEAAVAVGWAEETDIARSFRPTTRGRELREQVERLTNEYFYRSWSVLTREELDAFYSLLTKLNDGLKTYGTSG